MGAVSIRNLDDSVKEKLRIRAASHGKSMEAEIRSILNDAVNAPQESPNLGLALVERFGALGGIELDSSVRKTQPRAADFSL